MTDLKRLKERKEALLRSKGYSATDEDSGAQSDQKMVLNSDLPPMNQLKRELIVNHSNT
jgi:hypothetical protein